MSTKSRKRVREDEQSIPANKDISMGVDTIGEKRKRQKKANKLNRDQDTEKTGDINTAVGRMDGKLLADYFAQKAKRRNKDLTAIELDEIYVPEYAFLDTSSWQSPRTLTSLPSFLKKYSFKKEISLSKAPAENGTPHILVVTIAGLRAADLTRYSHRSNCINLADRLRALRPFQNNEFTVAKLFAKHIKLAQAQEFVKKTRIGIGVGTPARLNDLAESGALSLDSLKYVVIDGSYIDQKKRGIFDMTDLLFPLLKFLNRTDMRDRYKSSAGKLQVLVF
ncbi:Protein cms1 [Ophidiomyces ophidiicola]|nr:Protein cms1 [Ophidiomyces ophidiicola]